MAEILFVGNERVGARVAEVSGKEVEFTGDVTHIADIKDTIISKSYWAVIFDLSTFLDNYNTLAEEIDNLNHVSGARFLFYYLGKTPRSNLVYALTERGFTGFVTESIAGLANKQLQTALDGFASIEPYKPEHVSEDKVEQTSIEKKPTVISVAGCCNRIGTTTQALQIIKYLQFLGHKAAYIQLNDSEYVQKAAGLYSAEDIDRSLGRVTLNGTDLYSKPDQIAEIRGMGYEYLVYDFGSFSSKSFNLIQFLEKDIRIIVGGDSPHELGAMQDVFRSPILQNSTYYIFSFVHENDFQEIRGLMEDKADMTFFAKYTPDPFVYTSDSNDLYDKIIGATNTVEPQKRRECLLFSNTNRGTIRSGQICPLLFLNTSVCNAPILLFLDKIRIIANIDLIERNL